MKTCGFCRTSQNITHDGWGFVCKSCVCNLVFVNGSVGCRNCDWVGDRTWSNPDKVDKWVIDAFLRHKEARYSR